MPFKCFSPVATSASGLADEVIHDRQIVRRKIPNNVDVVLKQPQIDPGRIIVVQIAEGFFINQLADFPHRSGKQERMINHDFEILPRGQLNQFFGLCDADVNGFSTKTCLPFWRAAFASSKCVRTGVTTATASMSVEESNPEQSQVAVMPGYDFFAFANALGLQSQTSTT